MDENRPAEDHCHAQLRATMVWNLSAALSIWYQGPRPKLTQEQAEESVRLARVHLWCYAKLAEKALASKRLLYKVRPKHHYWEHMLDEVERLHANPMAQSNFIDEDNMKVLKNVSLACHARTVKTTWARRYVLKKAMCWLRLANRTPAEKNGSVWFSQSAPSTFVIRMSKLVLKATKFMFQFSGTRTHEFLWGLGIYIFILFAIGLLKMFVHTHMFKPFTRQSLGIFCFVIFIGTRQCMGVATLDFHASRP
jgi:hypothetical protein